MKLATKLHNVLLNSQVIDVLRQEGDNVSLITKDNKNNTIILTIEDKVDSVILTLLDPLSLVKSSYLINEDGNDYKFQSRAETVAKEEDVEFIVYLLALVSLKYNMSLDKKIQLIRSVIHNEQQTYYEQFVKFNILDDNTIVIEVDLTTSKTIFQVGMIDANCKFNNDGIMNVCYSLMRLRETAESLIDDDDNDLSMNTLYLDLDYACRLLQIVVEDRFLIDSDYFQSNQHVIFS